MALLLHTYYCITGSSFTWVYDTVTDAWHERASYGLDRWRAVCGTTFGTTNIVESCEEYGVRALVHTSRFPAKAELASVTDPVVTAEAV